MFLFKKTVAIGTGVAITMPDDEAWVVKSLSVEITTTSTAGDRTFQAITRNDSQVAQQTEDASDTQAASSTVLHIWNEDATDAQPTGAIVTACAAQLAVPSGGDLFLTQKTAITDASDSLVIEAEFERA